MFAYNLIIKCPRCTVNDNDDLRQFINTKLDEDHIVDYYGDELDNSHDYVDDVYLDEINSNTYITVHFEHPVEITENQAVDLLKECVANDKVDVSSHDGKDVFAVLLI